MSEKILIPDIGDFKEVAIIEIMVKVGDKVKVDDPLLTLESDKASMEVPSPMAGTIESLTVKVGDKVSEGSVIATIAVEGVAPVAEKTAPATTNAPSDAVDMVVLGAGPGGYSAAFRAADLGLKTVLVERHSTLGGVCLNVGCIPSKALLHVVDVMEEAQRLSKAGVSFNKPEIDIDALRKHKEGVISRLTGGLAMMAKGRKVEVVQGVAEFASANSLKVQLATGGEKVINFKQCIIAAGSESVKLPFMPNDDARVISSTGALALKDVPEKMLIVGGGIIGLEMATVYSALGAEIDVVEMLDGLMAGADADLVKVWLKRNPNLFKNIYLKTKTVSAEAKADGIFVGFEGDNAPKEPQRYDKVLVAVGRRPNGKAIKAELAGVNVDERGFIAVDKQMRTNQPHIFAIGDIVGQPMLAHKAVHEAHIAAEVAAGHKAYFDARVIPGVAYTSPEVAWVGTTEAIAKRDNLKIEKAIFPWAASGRAIANGCDDGFTKLIVDKETGFVIGGAIVGPNAGDMIGEIALAIEMNAKPEDIALTIHPHPTLGESIGLVAEAFLGTCTDLPPKKK